ncbi:MAG: penicillin-binding protein 2 [Minisyncoccia bacterium]
MESDIFIPSKELKNKKIKFTPKDIEPHEIILDVLAQKKEKELGLSEKKFETPILKTILQFLFVLCFFIIGFLFLKTFQLQVIESANLQALSDRNKFIVKQTQAERGIIYDQNHEQLVFNKITFDLVCEKTKIPEDENEKKRVFQEIARILNKDATNLMTEIDTNQFLIINNLTHQEVISLKVKIDELTGCQIRENLIREYKDAEFFAHLLGYLSRITKEEWQAESQFYSINDYVGRSGVEKSYEYVLRKNPGQLRIERDAFGQIISQEIVSPPESGKNIVLWLDADLQRKIKQELEKKYQEVGAKGAVGIALNPKTGGVLALVSLPSFDNNLFQKGTDPVALGNLLNDSRQPLFNRAISGRYPTGSTIKPLLALAALAENIISPEKQIYSPGYIEVPHRYNPEITYIFKDWTAHGWVDMRKAIAQSCNVYFYTIGGGYKDQKGLGPTKIKQYLQLFNWDNRTGIDLPGEISGFIPDPQWKKETLKENWWDGDTYNLSIGQGYLLISPLEVVTAFAAIANSGTLYQPQVVKEIIGSGEIPPKIIRQNFINPSHLQVIREGMRQAVTGVNSPLASLIRLNSLPVSAAGKTGTAELGNGRFDTWVTVFAPYEDPQIVLTLMIEDVKGIQTPVSVAQEVLNWYFSQQ